MPKSMTELVEDKICDIFSEFKTSHSLVQYITDGMPWAIAGYLQEKMIATGEDKVELPIMTKSGTLMTFGLECGRRGDSLSFTPQFSLGALGQSLVDGDSVKFDTDDLDPIGNIMMEDKDLIHAIRMGFASHQLKDGEWKPIKEGVHGLQFDEECDAACCAAAYFAVLIEVFCNYKDLTNEASYDVPVLGTFKIAPGKDNYTVTMAFTKDFKAACKSDALANKDSGK